MSRALPASFYTEAAGIFTPTTATAGPWSPKLQHAGPPSALLGRAFERKATELGLPFVARLTFSLFRPAKVDCRFETTLTTVRAGAKVTHLEASLRNVDDDVEVMRATSICMRTQPMAVPEPPAVLARAPPPTSGRRPIQFTPPDFGYAAAVQLECAEGEHTKGPTTMWAKQRVPLIAGEEPSPLQRTLLFADSAGGMSFYVNIYETSFLNADMTVNLLRPLEGEWVCMRSRTELNGALGVGLATAELHDAAGFVGLVSQQQLLEARL